MSSEHVLRIGVYLESESLVDLFTIYGRPDSPPGACGVTHGNNKDITIASWCLDTQTTSMVAATLIHEAAHVAGAPGGKSHMAERAVDKCGFHAEYDPELLGSLELYSYFLNRMS